MLGRRPSGLSCGTCLTVAIKLAYLRPRSRSHSGHLIIRRFIASRNSHPRQRPKLPLGLRSRQATEKGQPTAEGNSSYFYEHGLPKSRYPRIDRPSLKLLDGAC